MSANKNLVLRELTSQDLPAAAQLLSKTMLDNPVHIAVFGQNNKQRQAYTKDFFILLLPVINKLGVLDGVFNADLLVGVMGRIKPGKCGLPLMLKLSLAFKIFKKYGLWVGFKVLYWLFVWQLHDYKPAHWHLGPLAVATNYQQFGIASMLLSKAISGANNQPLWLETDKQLNETIYKKFGFVTQAKIKIYGVDNWLMLNKNT